MALYLSEWLIDQSDETTLVLSYWCTMYFQECGTEGTTHTNCHVYGFALTK